MFIASIYGITSVLSFTAELQLELQLKNKLYEEKYVEKEKNNKELFKTIASIFIPGYNIISKLYNLKHFDTYYHKKKNKLLKRNCLISLDNTKKQNYINGQLRAIENKVDEETKMTTKEKIAYLKHEKNIWLGDEEEVEYVLKKVK